MTSSGNTLLTTSIETDSNNNSIYTYSRVCPTQHKHNSPSSDSVLGVSGSECCAGAATSANSGSKSSKASTMLNLIVNKCTKSSSSSTTASSASTTSATHPSPNVSNRKSSRCGLSTHSTTMLSLFNPSSLLAQSSVLLVIIFINIVSSDNPITTNNLNNHNAGGGGSSSNPANIPDQIAMAAEHRIGHGGIPQGFGGALSPHGPADDNWPLASAHDMPQIKILQVQCEKSHMRVNIEFDRPFYGMIFSKGYYSDPHCVHLAPGSGHLSATFDVYLDACGMSSSANGNSIYGPAPSGTFVENTIIIQYDPLVQEVWDQARKLRCTWYDFYEKSVTFRPFQVDMLHAVTANFLGDNLQCWMQIQVGKGPWASEVSGIVKIGQTMTMVLAIKDDENKFDMLVRNCVAHDGKRAPIQLVDAYGCVTRPKIMSRFHKIKNFGASASVVSYAYFQAFKFPDSMNVHFQCVIQVCRFQCPEPKCGGEDVYALGGPGVPDPRIPHGAFSEAKETIAAPPSTIPESHGQNGEQISNSIAQPPQPQPPQHGLPQHHHNHHHQHQPMRGPPPPRPFPPHPHAGHPYNKPIPVPMPMPGSPSTIMLPPMPAPGYSSVKREGVILDDDNGNNVNNGNAKQDELMEEDDEDDEDEEPSFAALGGRPRSVDFDKDKQRMQKRSVTDDGEREQDRYFVVHMSHVYKREAQEMTDVETTRVIQVVAPGDVAFNLNGNGGSSGSSSAEDDSDSGSSVVVESSLRGAEIDGICMSVSSFVGGLVMLLLLLVISSLVAAFLFVRVRSIHRKTAVFAPGPVSGFDNTEFLKQAVS